MFAAGYCLAQSTVQVGVPGLLFEVGTDPGTPIYEVTSIFVANTDTSARSFSMYYVRDGASPVQTNALWFFKTLAANDTFIWQAQAPGGGIFMERGSSLYAISSTPNVVVASVFGMSSNVGGTNG